MPGVFNGAGSVGCGLYTLLHTPVKGHWKMRDPHKITQVFSQNVRREMDRLQMSGRELARRAESHPMTVCQCINGQTVPSMPLALAIARALETTVEALATEPARRKPAMRAKQTV